MNQRKLDIAIHRKKGTGKQTARNALDINFLFGKYIMHLLLNHSEKIKHTHFYI